ncbi:MAG: hypothetical protein IPF76_13255 [Sphingopyxis sp.]|nr:hypothetical protein [Sphingopyxis sp.]
MIEGVGAEADQPLLESMFEARKWLFIDLLDWDLEVVDERFKIDRFDDAYATYIVAVDGSRQHRASLRLLSSTRPHLLGSMFERLCTKGVPVGADIFEITLLCPPANWLPSATDEEACKEGRGGGARKQDCAHGPGTDGEWRALSRASCEARIGGQAPQPVALRQYRHAAVHKS